MALSFNTIATNILTGGTFVEFDNSRALSGLPGLPFNVLIAGQKLAAGTADELVPTSVLNEKQAAAYFGRESQLHRMVRAFRNNNATTEVTCIAIDDASGGTAATFTITISGTASANGTVALYIAGTRVAAGVTSGDDQDAVAAAINTAIAAKTGLPVTSAVVDEVVTLTARNKGTTGNDIDVRTNYYDADQDVAGVTVTIAAGTAGATDPDASEVITAMGDEWYHIIVWPWTDATSLTALEAELGIDDSDANGRWSGMRMIEGHAFACADGTHSAMSTLGDSRNNPHVTIFAANQSPTQPCEIAAAAAGEVAYHGQIDPLRPFRTLPLVGVMPPAKTDRWTRAERNLLLLDEIATTYVDTGGIVRIERTVTTYGENAQSIDDASYMDANTMLGLGYIRYAYRHMIDTTFIRKKLADNGTRVAAGNSVVVPNDMRDHCIMLARTLEENGYLENVDEWKDDIICERDVSDVNRLNVRLTPDLVNQLRVTAVQIQFRL